MSPMTDFPNKLISAPSVFVIGKTTFDKAGLDKWIDSRGFKNDPRYDTSPIKKIADLSMLTGGDHDESEIMSEIAGRFCYNSMMKGRESEAYIDNILEGRHGSVLHQPTYNLIIEGVSRSLSMELIRHSIGFTISQESQRFVDASEINFVVPPMMLHMWGGEMDCAEARKFMSHNLAALEEYRFWQDYIVSQVDKISDPAQKTMLKKRANEAARSVLPNCVETRMVWTGNLRALRHFCELRGAKPADLEIRRLAAVLASTMMDRAKFTFADFSIIEGDFGVPFVTSEHRKV